jgi:hypothetical protein
MASFEAALEDNHQAQMARYLDFSSSIVGCTQANRSQSQHPKGPFWSPFWNFNGIFYSIISSILSNPILKIFNVVNNGIFYPKYHQYQ